MDRQPDEGLVRSLAELFDVAAHAGPELDALLRARFDDRIRLIGADIEPARASRDGRLEMTFYYECLRPTTEDAQIFVHIEAVRGGTRFTVDHHPVRSRFPTSMWRQGDIVRDVVER